MIVEERERIYALLENERRLVIDEHTGNVVRREAWVVIDALLDSLIELRAVDEVTYE